MILIECLFALACLKFQCLSINTNNETTCECVNRRVPCDTIPDEENMILSQTCEQESPSQQKRELSWPTNYDGKVNTVRLQSFIDRSIHHCLYTLSFFLLLH